MSRYLRFFGLFFVLLMQGCGGGGGGGSSKDNTATNNGYSITVSDSSYTFNEKWGSDTTQSKVITATYKGDGLVVGYPPGVTVPTWLTIQSSGNSVTLTPNAYEFIGSRQTTLRFATGQADGSSVVYKDVNITLNIEDTLALTSTDTLVFGGIAGNPDFSDAQKISVYTGQMAWTLTGPDWLSFSKASGTGWTDVTIAVKPNALPAGNNVGVITATANGKTATKNITLALDGPRVWTASPHVALTFVGGVDALTKSISLYGNSDPALFNLSVQSGATWLTGSISNGRINVAADPTGLSDGYYQSELTVTSAATKLEENYKLVVGFYKQTTPAADSKEIIVFQGSKNARNINYVADTLRPHIYVYSRDLYKVEGYNYYTGDKILDLPFGNGSSNNITGISDDGNSLLISNGPQQFSYNFNSRELKDDKRNPNAQIRLAGKMFKVGGALSDVEITNDDGSQIYYRNPDRYNTGPISVASDYCSSEGGDVLFSVMSAPRPLRVHDVLFFQRAGFIKFNLKHQTSESYNSCTKFLRKDSQDIWFNNTRLTFTKGSGFGSSVTLPKPDGYLPDRLSFISLEADDDSNAYVIWRHFTGAAIQPHVLVKYDSAGMVSHVEELSGDSPEIYLPQYSNQPQIFLSGDNMRLITVRDSFSAKSGHISVVSQKKP